MDGRSELELLTVHPKLADAVRAAADALYKVGTAILVVSGRRTAAEQTELYAQGRTAPGHVVTNAKAGQSMHNYGLAVDVVPFLSGNSGALNWNARTPQFEAMAAALKAQGLVWGGDWKRLKDYDHFQMPDCPVNPSTQMQRDYGDGDKSALQGVWAKYAEGKYKV